MENLEFGQSVFGRRPFSFGAFKLFLKTAVGKNTPGNLYRFYTCYPKEYLAYFQKSFPNGALAKKAWHVDFFNVFKMSLYFTTKGVYRKIGIPVRNYFAFNIEASAMS